MSIRDPGPSTSETPQRHDARLIEASERVVEQAGYSIESIVYLLQRAAMASTYKPALLRALARICSTDECESVPLWRIGEEFAHLYWDQTVRYGLRQAPQIKKEPVVIHYIRALSARLNVRDYNALPGDARDAIAQRLVGVVAHDVIPRLHRSKPRSMPNLYAWSPGEPVLALQPGAGEFLRRHRAGVELAANYYWAKFLEKYNALAPRVMEKVEGVRPRQSVRKYLALLLAIDPHCFYCGAALEENASTHIDHVISWNFLLENYLWDLVPACTPCNLSKSNALPPSRFIEKLEARNAGPLQLAAQQKDLAAMADLQKFYEAAVAMEWPSWDGNIRRHAMGA